MENIKNLRVYEKALIVVDMVNGFVREGVLHDDKIADVIPSQVKLIKEYLKDEQLVIFIKDTHEEDAVEFKRFGNTKHCVKGTTEAELVDELKVFEELENVISIEKNSTVKFLLKFPFNFLREVTSELLKGNIKTNQGLVY